LKKYTLELSNKEIETLNKFYKIELSNELEIETSPEIEFLNPQQENIILKFTNREISNKFHELLKQDFTGVFFFEINGIIEFENVRYTAKFAIRQNNDLLSATIRTF